MSLLLLLRQTAPVAPGGSSRYPASLPSLGLMFEPVLSAEYGTYSISGQDATLTYTLPGNDSPAPLPHLGLLGGLGTGNSATVSAETGFYSVSGQNAGLHYGRWLVAAQGAYTVTGQDASLVPPSSGYSPAPLPHLSLLSGLGQETRLLVAETIYSAVIGQAAGLRRTYRLAADFGTYTVTGGVTFLRPSQEGSVGAPAPLPHLGLMLQSGIVNYTLTADPGVYTVVGSDALADLEITAEQGTITISGQDATLARSYIMSAESGSYFLDFQDADLVEDTPNRTLAAETGYYTTTGQDATLRSVRVLSAVQGFYALLGQQADFARGFVPVTTLPADQGTVTIAGQAATLTYSGKRLAAETGAYSVNGQNADLVKRDKSGQVVSAMPAGGGIPARTRRAQKKYHVEIDGETFVVETMQEVEELFSKAREEAEKQAKLALERAAKVQKRPARKVLADARKALKVPTVKVDGEQEYADKFRDDIEALYRSTLDTIEIGALMRSAERRQDEDDEDVLLLL